MSVLAAVEERSCRLDLLVAKQVGRELEEVLMGYGGVEAESRRKLRPQVR